MEGVVGENDVMLLGGLPDVQVGCFVDQVVAKSGGHGVIVRPLPHRSVQLEAPDVEVVMAGPLQQPCQAELQLAVARSEGHDADVFVRTAALDDRLEEELIEGGVAELTQQRVDVPSAPVVVDGGQVMDVLDVAIALQLVGDTLRIAHVRALMPSLVPCRSHPCLSVVLVPAFAGTTPTGASEA